MYKLKVGFTLNEILITTGIIGILAMLTIPPLTDVSRNVITGKKLAKTYELVQNGMKNVMSYAAENHTDQIFTTLDGIQIKDIDPFNVSSEKDDFILVNDNGKAIFSKTLGLIGAEAKTSSYLSDIKTYSDDNISTMYEDFTTWDIYKFSKNNGYIIVQPVGNLPVGNIESNVVLTRIFIDINEEKIPNQIGKDIFLFGLANNGHLVPAGSSAYNNNIFAEIIPAFDMSNIGDGRACASSVIQNNWKIIY